MTARIRMAIVLAPHGVRGQMVVRSLAQRPEDLFDYAPLTDESGARVFKLEKRGVKKDGFIVAVEGIATRDEAESLKGQGLFVARDKLPEPELGEVYLADVIGLIAKQDGKTLGTVEAFHDYGAGVFLEITPVSGPSFMLPFKDPFVQKIDLAQGALEVSLPGDWLKEEKDE